MNETEEQQKCNYYHGDLPIMNMDDGNKADVWVSGSTLEVSATATDTCGAYINYCPKCGRKLS